MAEETLETVMTPLSPTEAGAPPKISPFGAASAAPAAASTPPSPPPVAASAVAPAAAAPASVSDAAPAAAPAPASASSAPAPTPPAAATPSAPAAASAPSAQPHTIRLKPVIRKPMIRKPMAPAARPAAAPVQKKATANLNSVTGPVPAQAILKKTGIVAEGILTPAQAQAAKSKTTRISLESAIGVAPAKETPVPLKTIRLRRPSDLKQPGPTPLKPASSTPAPASAPLSEASTVVTSKEPPTMPTTPAPLQPVSKAEAAENADQEQKKTLKLHRPGISGKRPSLGIKRPSSPAAAPAAPAGDDGVAELPPADLSGDVPELKPLTAADFGAPKKELSAGVPKGVMILSLITSLAALVVIGFVAFLLVQEGCGPDAGENAMAFIQTN